MNPKPANFVVILIKNFHLILDKCSILNFFFQFTALKTCAVDTASEYEYKNFFDLNKFTEIKEKKGGSINLKIFIIGKRDANILLSPVEYPNDGKLSYEFGKYLIYFDICENCKF